MFRRLITGTTRTLKSNVNTQLNQIPTIRTYTTLQQKSTTSKKSFSSTSTTQTKSKSPLQKLRRTLPYTTVPLFGWTFANSPTFDKELDEQVKSTNDKVNPPVIQQFSSDNEGLKSENFASWIRAILTQAGHYDPTQTENDINIFSTNHDDIEDEIDRVHLEPDTFKWCKTNLDEIFRFSNYDGMNDTYQIDVPVHEKLEDFPKFNSNDELYRELIKYKTFIEKERYKYFRIYEEVIEHTAELGQSLDMINVQLAQINRFDENMKRYQSPILAPIYKSIYDSLLSVMDVSVILDKPLLHAQHFDEQIQKLFDEKLDGHVQQLFPQDKTTWNEQQHKDFEKLQYAVYSRALHMLRQEALSLNQANIVIGSLQHLYHELSWDFKTYYDPATYQKIIGYAEKEVELTGDERDEYFKNCNQLPIPPLFDLNATNILNLFIHKQNLKEINTKLHEKQQQELNDNKDNKDNNTNVIPFDSDRITFISTPTQLMFRLLNENKETIIPSIHHRSLVYHEFTNIIDRVQKRPYVLYGLQQRMMEHLQNPQALIDAQNNTNDIKILRDSYIHSAKEQRQKKRSKKQKKLQRQKRAEKKAAKKAAAGFENFNDRHYHPDHNDLDVLEHEEKEFMDDVVQLNTVPKAILPKSDKLIMPSHPVFGPSPSVHVNNKVIHDDL